MTAAMAGPSRVKRSAASRRGRSPGRGVPDPSAIMLADGPVAAVVPLRGEDLPRREPAAPAAPREAGLPCVNHRRLRGMNRLLRGGRGAGSVHPALLSAARGTPIPPVAAGGRNGHVPTEALRAWGLAREAGQRGLPKSGGLGPVGFALSRFVDSVVDRSVVRFPTIHGNAKSRRDVRARPVPAGRAGVPSGARL